MSSYANYSGASGGGGGSSITSLTGDVTATGPGAAAASLVATTNATLTTLSSLALPQSQVTGLSAALALKSPLASPTFTGTIGTGLTANRTVQTDSSGNLATFPENATTTSAATHTIDWNNGPAQSIQLHQSVTLVLNNPSSGQAYVLRILQDTSFRGVTWPASVKWAGGIAPVITQVVSAIDMISLYYDGTSYWGTYAQNFS